MPQPSLAVYLETAQLHVERFMGAPEANWQYMNTANEPDMAIGICELEVPATHSEDSKCIIASQWLGREAAFGDVRYSARFTENSPMIVWRSEPNGNMDASAWDVLTQERVPLIPALVHELAEDIMRAETRVLGHAALVKAMRHEAPFEEVLSKWQSLVCSDAYYGFVAHT